MNRGRVDLRDKSSIREFVWRILEGRGVAAFPKPVRGRIPNFIGAEEAARRVFETKTWREAEIVKVNPDSPQKPVRLEALRSGKILLMPTPRIKQGFIILNPSIIPRNAYGFASTIKGSFRYGRKIGLRELVKLGRVDLIVEGSVAVSRADGSRLGKGEGYGELEYAILRELELIDEDVPIVTTVHELQVFDEPLPQDEWDVSVDVIATPKRLIRVGGRRARPRGLIWSKMSREKVNEIPMLKELLRVKGGGFESIEDQSG